MRLSSKAMRLTKFAQKNNRVCPHKWLEMYELLPNRRRNPNGGSIPPLPLILAAWWETTPEQKMMRLREHIEYADKNGAIDAVNKFLRSLKESEWHHIGE